MSLDAVDTLEALQADITRARKDLADAEALYAHAKAEAQDGTPYVMGFTSRQSGCNTTDNPYRATKSEEADRDAWYTGWIDADERIKAMEVGPME